MSHTSCTAHEAARAGRWDRYLDPTTPGSFWPVEVVDGSRCTTRGGEAVRGERTPGTTSPAEWRPMGGIRHTEEDPLPATGRGEDPPAEKTSSEMTSIEHFLSDYAAVPAEPALPHR